MASLFQIGPKGRKVWAVDVYGRGRIRLGRNAKDAATCLSMIERLEVSAKYGTDPAPPVLAWADRISTALRDRLVALGLLRSGSATIADLVALSERMNTGKPSTQRLRSNAYESVAHFFKPETVLSSITETDAQEFRIWLAREGRRNRDGVFTGEPLAAATVSKRIKRARKMFRLAVGSKWITDNPFQNVTGGNESNPSALTFITADMTARIFDQLTSTEDRLIFALARWGGMRCPSEPAELRWDGIDWARLSMRFRTPKTEHHPGRESRVCPIFPELRPYLEAAYEAAPAKAVYCCPSLRVAGNPRTRAAGRIERAIERAQLPKIPKLFTSLRATRATEVDDAFGSKAESVWIGHGAEIAMRHYLMITDEKWARATGVSAQSVAADNPVGPILSTNGA